MDIITSLPDGFTPAPQIPDFFPELNIRSMFKPERIGGTPWGDRWHAGPICLERYISDLEPDLEASQRQGRARSRLVLWERLTRTDVPTGWRQLGRKPSRLDGFVELKPNESHLARWSESAKRYLKVWHKRPQGTFELEPVTLEEFETYYKHSGASKHTQGVLFDVFKQKVARGAVHTIRAVRNLSTGTLVAGLITVEAPAYQSSYYEIGFVATDAPPMAMPALMDEWAERSRTAGIRFLHLGGFWYPGKPRNWKGFSRFKAKLGPYYVESKPVLVRWVRGRLNSHA